MSPALLDRVAPPHLAWVRETGGTSAATWVAQHSGDAPATSAQDAERFAFQRWYRFKEAFSPGFVVDALRETEAALGRPVRTCLDPFGGSGTTALTCQFLGVRPTTIEVNPFLADLIEAKLAAYDAERLIAARSRLATLVDAVATSAARPHRAEPPSFPGAPPTFVEPGRGGRWVFDAAIASRLCAYRDAIAALKDDGAARLCRVLLGSVLLSVSNVVVNGKGRRYRAPSRRSVVGPEDVDVRFEAAFQRALYDVCRYAGRACPAYTLLRGDARERTGEAEPADLVLFSPPYPNSFDYTDIYNVELWALGYLGGGADNRALRDQTLRSHVQVKRDFAPGEDLVASPTLARTEAALRAAGDALWDRDIPAMVSAYFGDLTRVLRGALGVLAPGGRVMMVVGDSRYAGVHVDVPSIVRELAPAAGLRCTAHRPVRAMRSSAQQGGGFTLDESLLVLERHRR